MYDDGDGWTTMPTYKLTYESGELKTHTIKNTIWQMFTYASRQLFRAMVSTQYLTMLVKLGGLIT